VPPTIEQTLADGSGKQQLIPCLLDSNRAWVRDGERAPLCQNGLRLLKKGNWSAAAALFEQAAAKSPQNAVAVEYQGLALYMQSTFGSQNPSRDEGLNNINQNQISEAGKCFARSIQLHPECAILYRNLGLALSLFNRNQALSCYRQAVSRAAKDPRCLLSLGGSLSHLGRYDEALAVFNRGLTICPESEQFLFNKANTLLSAGHYEECLKAYDRLLAIQPDFEVGFYERGIARAVLKHYKGAMTDFERAIALKKTYAAAYDYRALVSGASGDNEGAVRDSRLAIQYAPGVAYFHYNLAWSLFRICKYQEALNEINKAIELGLNSSDAFACRGLILASTGKLDQALKNADISLQLAPLNQEALFLRAHIFQKKGDFEQATIDFDSAKRSLAKQRLSGTHIVTNSNGWLLHSINDLATESAQKAALAGLSNQNTPVSKKQLQETLKAYTRLIAMNPERSELYYERAIVYMSSEDYRSALKEFEYFFSLHPEGAVRATAALLEDICLESVGKKAEGRELLLKEKKLPIKNPFLKSLLDFSLGNLSEKQLLALVNNDTEASQAFFYIAMRHKQAGETSKTKEYLGKLLSTNMFEIDEYQIALSVWNTMRNK
jgi:tetratricopeptide (TPR) repeat protein